MRIGVDATSWANGRGYGRFTRQLLPAMASLAPNDELLCFLDRRSLEQFDLVAPNVRPVEVTLDQAPTEAASANGYRSPRDMLRLTKAVWRAKPDVFFAPTVYTYFPLPPGLRAVITVHDAIAERFPELTLPTTRARWLWRAKVAMAMAQARLVLTVSDYSAKELVEVLRIPAARIRVALEAPAPAFRPSESGADITRVSSKLGLTPETPWFVYVGGFNPHKNLDVVVRAHADAARESRTPPHLVLVGTIDRDVFHSDQARIRALIDELGTGPLVHWPGFVPDDELRHLYSGAVALLLPSECEGFGLPAVEAAACGTPAIATTESPLPELLEGGGYFVAPRDVGAIAQAMRALLSDPSARAVMAGRALEQSRRLSWERGARSALDAIYEAAR